MTNSLQFGYTFIFVPDVKAALAFYKKAFNIESGYIGAEHKYAELVTGGVKIGLVDEAFFKASGHEITSNNPHTPAPGLAIGLVTDDVASAYQHAIANGAVLVKEPAQKPWGQTVSYVRDCHGVLVEICSPIAS